MTGAGKVMGSSIPSTRSGSDHRAEANDHPPLRAPGERGALVYCIAANFVVLGLAVAIIFLGTDWLAAHPFVAKHIDAIRTVLVAAAVALPATIVGRRVAIPDVRGGGVRVSKDQFPELHDALERACRELGIARVPALYLSRSCTWPAAAHSAGGDRAVVVLNARLIGEDWRAGLDWLTFVLAGALGSLRLGHTRWWVELFTVYTKVLPWLRTPLLVRWALSRDRCAAFVVPDGIRGLVVEAVGRTALPHVDLVAFCRQLEEPSGFWDFVGTLRDQRPGIAARARALYDAGFFERRGVA